VSGFSLLRPVGGAREGSGANKTPAKPVVPGPAPVAIRSARKDGREVATLRCFEQEPGEFVIECEAYPVGRMVVEPLRPGPYRFRSMREASSFMDEAALCLKYLGCDVA
jgi:hypothetical protein